MALIQVHFWSDALNLQCQMWVLLPQNLPKRGSAGHPTLYLLHGLSDDHTIWMRRTSLERYVEGRRLAVVMPSVHRSFYTDMASGGRYWQFISRDVPGAARTMFRLSNRRGDNFVAGLSMGGYGAFKLALRQPRHWAAAASLSGAMDITRRFLGEPGDRLAEMQRIFGSARAARGSDNDLFHLATRLRRSTQPRPALYQLCGDQDFLHPENLAFRDHCRKLGLALRYEEDAGFGHTWDYWDLGIRRVLDWLEGLSEA